MDSKSLHPSPQVEDLAVDEDHQADDGAAQLPKEGNPRVTPGFKAKLNAHSMCAQESCLHT
jgi:hypothetical protein